MQLNGLLLGICSVKRKQAKDSFSLYLNSTGTIEIFSYVADGIRATGHSRASNTTNIKLLPGIGTTTNGLKYFFFRNKIGSTQCLCLIRKPFTIFRWFVINRFVSQWTKSVQRNYFITWLKACSIYDYRIIYF